MTSTFEDAPLDHSPVTTAVPLTMGTGERKKLQLKPRSDDKVGEMEAPLSPRSPRSGRRVKSLSARGDPFGGASPSAPGKLDPFGGAKPREDVLKERGIDSVEIDKKIEQKSRVTRLTSEQDAQVEALRAELTKLEEAWREANEMELPEEELRVQTESKRKELQALMDSLKSVSVSAGSNSGSGAALPSTKKKVNQRAVDAVTSSAATPSPPAPGGRFGGLWTDPQSNRKKKEPSGYDSRSAKQDDSAVFSAFSSNRRRGRNSDAAVSRS